MSQLNREPQPGDGPDYHAEHAAWEGRQQHTLHRVTITRQGRNTWAACIDCTWLFETTGTDESASNAAKSASARHEEVTA